MLPAYLCSCLRLPQGSLSPSPHLPGPKSLAVLVTCAPCPNPVVPVKFWKPRIVGIQSLWGQVVPLVISPSSCELGRETIRVCPSRDQRGPAPAALPKIPFPTRPRPGCPAAEPSLEWRMSTYGPQTPCPGLLGTHGFSFSPRGAHLQNLLSLRKRNGAPGCDTSL